MLKSKPIIWKVIFLASMAVVLLLTGCASNQKYPEEWAPLQIARAGECPDLTGTYTVFDPQIMWGIGFSEQTILAGTVNAIKIKQPLKDFYQFSAYAGFALVEQIVIQIDGKMFSCAVEGLSIATGSQAVSGEGMIVFGSRHYVINKAIDGSLVIKVCDSEYQTCCLFPVPLGGKECKYQRYLP